jgi:hypothetical protein
MMLSLSRRFHTPLLLTPLRLLSTTPPQPQPPSTSLTADTAHTPPSSLQVKLSTLPAEADLTSTVRKRSLKSLDKRYS